jgi:hypothetical protein
MEKSAAREACRPSFHTHTDICSLNHRDIVATIANAAHALLGIFADQARHIGFLCWRAATCDDGWQLYGDRNEFLSVVCEHEREGLAVDEKTGVGFAAQEIERRVGKIFAFYYEC